MDGKIPMTTRTDMQNPRGTDYEHWKVPASQQPQREPEESKELKEIREMFAELERKEKHLAAFREVMKL
jgi:hypothetical protein